MNHLTLYIKYLQSLGYAKNTWEGHYYRLKQFKWKMGIEDERLVRDKDIEEYEKILKERKLKQKTINMSIVSIKKYFHYLVRCGYLLESPAEHIEIVKGKKSDPRDILTLHEMEWLLKKPGTSIKGMRDRAIIEVMYASGIRSKELSGLDLGDLNLKDHELYIRNTKTRQERIVPLGVQARKTLEEYLKNIRPRLLRNELEQAVFLGMVRGERIKHKRIGAWLSKYVKQAGITKKITPHSLRHTCATHMLQKGAPLEIIQRILGHKNIGSTEVYTRVLKEDLKRSMRKIHGGHKRVFEKKRIMG